VFEVLHYFLVLAWRLVKQRIKVEICLKIFFG